MKWRRSLTPIPGETVYQNLARVYERNDETLLARWVAFFGSDSLDGMFKRFCFHKRSAYEKQNLPKLNPNQAAKSIPAIDWIEREVGELTLYALFEQLIGEGEGAEDQLAELCHLVGCTDPDELMERLDWTKVPDTPRIEEQAPLPRGGDEEVMSDTSKNGERLAREVQSCLGFRVNPDSTLVRLHAVLTETQRGKLYEVVGVDDQEGFASWAEAEQDEAWEPMVLDSDEDEEEEEVAVDPEDEEDEEDDRDEEDDDESPAARRARQAVVRPAEAVASEPTKAEPEVDFAKLVETAEPFATLEEFVGQILSPAGYARLAVTSVTLWGIDKEMTFAHAVWVIFKKHEGEDGTGLIQLSKLARGRRKDFRDRLPDKIDTLILQQMKNEEARRIAAQKQAGQPSTHVAGSAAATSIITSTNSSGAPSAQAGKKEEAIVGNKTATPWKTTTAEGLPGAEPGEMLQPYMLKRWEANDTADHKVMADEIAAKYPNYGIDFDKVMQQITYMKSLRRKGGGATPTSTTPTKPPAVAPAVPVAPVASATPVVPKAMPKKAEPKKAAPKAAPKKAAPKKAVAKKAESKKTVPVPMQIAAVHYVFNRRMGDLLRLCEAAVAPDPNWPAPLPEQTLTSYVTLLKSEPNFDRELVCKVIAANTDLGLKEQVTSLDPIYDAIDTIEPTPAPAAPIEPPPAPVPVDPPACGACGGAMIFGADSWQCPQCNRPNSQLARQLELDLVADLLVEVYVSAGNTQAADLVKMTHLLAPDVARAVVLKAVKTALLG